MVRRIAVAALMVGLVLGAGVFVTHRLQVSDPSRSVSCRVLGCPAVDGYDRLCGLFAQAELLGFESASVQQRWLVEEARALEGGAGAAALLQEVLTATRARRYSTLRRAVGAQGAPRWQCPAAERTLPALPGP